MEGLLQIVILICLIVVIILLLVDKVKIIRAHQEKKDVKKDTIPDVIGKVLVAEIEKIPVWMANRKKLVEQLAAGKVKQSNSESIKNEQQEEKNFNAHITQNDDDGDDAYPDDDRFGQGVTLKELAKVGNLLQRDTLDTSQEQETADIIQKIQGTEFFSMMQDSIDGASQKIAKLLDKTLSQNPSLPSGSSKVNDIEGFNISDFI